MFSVENKIVLKLLSCCARMTSIERILKKIRLSKTSSRLMVTAALKKILRGVSK